MQKQIFASININAGNYENLLEQSIKVTKDLCSL